MLTWRDSGETGLWGEARSTCVRLYRRWLTREQHVGPVRHPVRLVMREGKLRFGRREPRDTTRNIENGPPFLGKTSSKAGDGRKYHRFGMSEIPDGRTEMAGLKAEIPLSDT